MNGTNSMIMPDQENVPASKPSQVSPMMSIDSKRVIAQNNTEL